MNKRLLGWALVVFGFGGAFYATYRSQDIIDWWKLRDYEPSARIVTIVDDTGMNGEGQKLFYLNDPQIIDSKTEFQEACRTSNEIIVLGCHIQNQGIYVFDVDDERLDGIVEVTSAHEMLHEAYDRLTTGEREEIVALLESHYDEIKDSDERLRETIDSYARRDPNVVPNELHSILGTEVRDLPTRLSEYYERYFEDRNKVVTLAEAYDEAFAERQDQINAFDAQLEELQGDIARLEAQITDEGAALEVRRNELDALRASDPTAYNAQVPGYNASVQAYNALIAELRSKIDQFNQIVAARNEIALEERELVDAIDSRVDQL